MSKDISFQIEATNLGPHTKLKADLKVGSLQLGIFAMNGTGKTFISRPLRLIGDKTLVPEDSNRLLTITQNVGAFQLAIRDPKGERLASVKFDRNNVPVIKNLSGYIFHVFNRDYLKENLEELKYRPNGEIKGYILGKEKIDLSKEKASLTELVNNYDKTVKSLQKEIELALKDLDKLGIRKNTNEYAALTYENVMDEHFVSTEIETFEQLAKKHSKLKSMPDALPDLSNVETLQDNGVFTGVITFLQKEFSKSKIAEEFKSKIRGRQTFIEEGLGFWEKSKATCPFCEQVLESEALKLIDIYVSYFSDVEAKQIKAAEQFVAQLSDYLKKANKIVEDSALLNASIDRYKSFLPSAENLLMRQASNTESVTKAIDVLKRFLTDKKNNIAAVWQLKDINAAIKPIIDWERELNKITRGNDEIVNYINEQKNNLQSEKLQLNRRLCRARFLQLRKIQISAIEGIKKLSIDIEKLKLEIQKKEQNEKIDKKAKVIEVFESLLSRFFGDKYEFDRNSFCLRFQKSLLTENASDVLSDGEKNIVAFCFFLAETFTIMNSEEDFSRLFFIIDDPISSLDFHYVYAVAQCLRNLDKIFGIERVRYIILTHNLEFMSILIRNNIIKHKFLLTTGGICDLKRDLIMPYEEHLRDIYEVASGIKVACHTTANSIRHVLETINKFVSPDMDLQSFCDTINGFNDNAFLYSLMHDVSHGGIRVQRPYTPEMVAKACMVVVDFIGIHFKGQLTLLSK
jgi:hypothetical protein